MTSPDLLQHLIGLLNAEPRLAPEGPLTPQALTDAARQPHPALVERLLADERTRKHFFVQAGPAWVFQQEKLVQLLSSRALMSQQYTAYQNKIGLTASRRFLATNGEVVLDWPYKDCLLAGGQTREEAARQETFWNETLAPEEVDRLLSPKALHRFSRFTPQGSQLVEMFGPQDSYLFRGNNLMVLHSLLPRFEGQVKLIYIDPPYNTGSDSFRYNDRFNHATWLTFMRNRLEVARRLLRPDGAIFIQIDDQEMAYLKVLCDEIFGRQNFKECVAVKNGSESGVNAINVMRGEQLFKVKEHLLYYAKDGGKHRFRPLYVKAIAFNDSYRQEVRRQPDGSYTVTDAYKQVLRQLFGQDTLQGLSQVQKQQFYATFEEYCLQNRTHLYALKTDIQKSGDAFKAFAAANRQKGIVEEYTTADGRTLLVYKGGMLTPLKERVVEEGGQLFYGTLISDFWWDIGATPSAEGGVVLKAGKKPEKLLKRILQLCTEEGDLVLDFFLGSGTTAATALKMNRRFIGIEQLNYGENDALVRLQRVLNADPTGISADADVQWKGGGSFIYAELLPLNQTLMEEVLSAPAAELPALLGRILQTGFPDFRFADRSAEELHALMATLLPDEQRQLLTDLLDKNMLYVPYSEMEDARYLPTDPEVVRLNHLFYGHVSS